MRRTFIESIVQELCEYGWADKETWKRKLEELANRRKKTTTRITPKPTDLGKAMAISLLAVPLGTAFIAGGFRSGVSIGVGLAPNWFFCVGLCLVLSPFWVLLYRLVQLRTKVEVLSPGLIPFGAMSLAEGIHRSTTIEGTLRNGFFWAGCFLLISPVIHWLYRWWNVSDSEGQDASNGDGEADEKEDKDWAFLISRAINETETESIETPNPTSIEFDSYFAELMKESLENKSRRLLVVLDNLDRVDAETALSIWGTLQTFLHDRDHGTEEWHKQIWVVVPYDPNRIRKLWNHPKEQSLADHDEQSANGKNEARRTTESFLDKSFQVRFHVAPPVLSDWKSFLYELVKKALPSHEDDCHFIYRVFDHCRARGGDPPTPRELKLFVNQIGAIHRQWQHEFPLSHVAFFVLSRKKHPKLIDAMRKDDFLSKDDQRLLSGDDLIGSLAGLAFNVKANKGLELLLADSIDEALRSSEPEELSRIAERNGAGFWAVLETIATTRWHEEDALGLTKIAAQLSATRLLEPLDKPEKQSVYAALRDAGANMKAWTPLSKEFGAGICELLSIQNEIQFSTTVLKQYCTSIAKEKSSEKEAIDASVVAQTTFTLFDHATSLGHSEAIPKTVALPFQGSQWITACSAIESADAAGKHWGRIKPKGKIDDVLEAFTGKVSEGEFSASDITAVNVTGNCALKVDWSEFCTGIKTRLDASQSASAAECSDLLQSLFQLEAIGVEAANSIQTALCQPGHLLHHFHQANSHKNVTGKAAIVLSFARKHPSLNKPTTAGNSEAGFQALTTAMSQADDELVSEVYRVAERYEMLPNVLSVVLESESQHELLVSVLKRVADSETPEIAFTTEVIENNWSAIRSQLNESGTTTRFQALVGKLARSKNLTERFVASDFDPSSALLYLDILRGAKGAVPNFVEWVREGLRSMTKDQWDSDLSSSQTNCSLCIELSKQGSSADLANNFADSLHDHAKEVIKGENTPKQWKVREWARVIGSVDESSGTRKVLREHLVDVAVSASGEISEDFFGMYGNEIEDIPVLAAHPHILSRFFTPLISEAHEPGLTWLVAFAKKHPGFISKVEAEHTAQDFAARLQGLIDNPSEEESQAEIDSIAASFGIVPTPEPELDSKENEELASEEGDVESQ